jgi:lipopolysaccharide/colanic/teichoic acid biosynthesis glycosyltransferase
MFKRLFDLIISAAALLVFSPLLLALAAAIKIGSPGPVFYRGVRVGRFGRKFRIFKFRTMVIDAEKIGGPSTPDDDPRITRIGKFLRKRKLDELPQFINVLLGDMSLVGPRPEVSQYVDLYTEEERAILSVRPGVTDWASIWNPDEGALLAGSPDPEKTYLEQIRPQKIRLQLEYVRKQSFLTDLSILGETARIVLLGKKGMLTTSQGVR